MHNGTWVAATINTFRSRDFTCPPNLPSPKRFVQAGKFFGRRVGNDFSPNSVLSNESLNLVKKKRGWRRQSLFFNRMAFSQRDSDSRATACLWAAVIFSAAAFFLAMATRSASK